jgi:hypothetical protein
VSGAEFEVNLPRRLREDLLASIAAMKETHATVLAAAAAAAAGEASHNNNGGDVDVAEPHVRADLLFDTQSDVFSLLQDDSFQRFKASTLFQDFIAVS